MNENSQLQGCNILKKKWKKVSERKYHRRNYFCLVYLGRCTVISLWCETMCVIRYIIQNSKLKAWQFNLPNYLYKILFKFILFMIFLIIVMISQTPCWAFALFIFYMLLPLIFVFIFWYFFHNFFSIQVRAGFIKGPSFFNVIIYYGSITLLITNISVTFWALWSLACPRSYFLPAPVPSPVGSDLAGVNFLSMSSLKFLVFFSNPGIIIIMSKQFCSCPFMNGTCVGSCLSFKILISQDSSYSRIFTAGFFNGFNGFDWSIDA